MDIEDLVFDVGGGDGDGVGGSVVEVEMEMVLEGVWWRCLTVCLYAVLAWNARHEECERTGISVETNWW